MPPSLLSLPAEVQRLIWMHLCHHCNGTASGSHRVDIFMAHRDGLRSLTETCRTLRDTVRPFLYHWIDNYINLNSLMRQLIERPDLAGHVLELACFSSLPPMDIWRRQARKLHLIERDDADFMTPADVGTRSMFYTIELLLAMLPNIKKATMWANSKRNYMETGVALDCLATRTSYLAPAPCLPNLQVVSLTNILEYEGLELDPDATPILFNAAPNLRHMSVSECYGFTTAISDNLSTLALKKVKILELPGYPLRASPLDECEYDQTRELVRLCPGLQDVRIKPCGVAYWDNDRGFQAFSPLKLLKSLEPAAETLRSLTLDTSVATIYPDVEGLGPTLAKFIKLEKLTLEEQSFCQHWLKGPLFQPVSHEPAECITSILPRSVRQLNIILHITTEVIGDILHLGNCVKDGHFPALDTLTVIMRPIQKSLAPPDRNKLRQVLFRHRDDITKAFQGSLVTISFFLGW